MEKMLNLIECSIADDRHIVEKPICLSCGHFICKKCIPSNNNYEFKCIKCDKVNKTNLNLCEVSELVQYSIESNLATLLKTINGNIEEELNKFKNLKSTMKEKYHSQIEFFRDEIDIRVDSLKTELDILREEFNKRLDAAKKEIDKEIDALNDSQDDESSNENISLNNSLESFYKNQTFLRQLKKKSEGKNDLFTLDFELSEFKHLSAHIGEFSLFSGVKSKILSNEEMIALERLCGVSMKQRSLLYRASEHGYEVAKFHEKCDKIPNTLTVIKSANGFIFGGFTSNTWDGPDAHKRDDKAFIFSLKNKENKAEKMIVNPTSAHFAIVSNPSLGPTFGQYRRNFCIKDCSNQNVASYSDFSSSDTYVTSGKKADDFLAGSRDFQVSDIEVYQLNDFN